MYFQESSSSKKFFTFLFWNCNLMMIVSFIWIVAKSVYFRDVLFVASVQMLKKFSVLSEVAFTFFGKFRVKSVMLINQILP